MAEAVDARKHHFRLAYGALALAFWISVAGFVVLLTRSTDAQHSVAWSHWRPDAQGLLGAHQIAQQVGPRYKGSDGTQLAAVQEHGPSVAGVHLEAVGVRKLARNGQVDPYIGVFPTNRTLIYAFCGLQSGCSIDSTATVKEQTLRREALELSLYAFKYLKNVDQVVSLVHTVKDGGTSAIFLRKEDLEDELEHPLRATLPRVVPPPASTPLDRREGAIVDALTLPNTYPAHYEPLPDGDAILVLDVAAEGGS